MNIDTFIDHKLLNDAEEVIQINEFQHPWPVVDFGTCIDKNLLNDADEVNRSEAVK